MPASSQAEEASLFTLLTECLSSAAEEHGTILTLPNEVIAQFKKGILQDDSSIRDFNKLFARSDHTNRLRLDHVTFINVVAILLHLPYSHHQEKALFAFMDTIGLFKRPAAIQAILAHAGIEPASAEELQIKHVTIYNKLIHKMMQILVLGEQEPSMRLMAGHILYALIHSSDTAQEIVRKYPEKERLGFLVDTDDDYVLRIFTANIVREMCAVTSNPREFWPQISKKRREEHDDFPVSVTPDSAWLGAVADYISSNNASRGFRGDSQPVVSKLVSIDTGTYTFKDDPRANILAVVDETFVFVIPGNEKSPLAMLELELDSQCTCLVNERTSPDNRSDDGENAEVLIETAKRGFQKYQGTRSALDAAVLALPQYTQSEAFAEHAQRCLHLATPRIEDGSADTEASSRAASRSFRMLAHGMVDVDMEGDPESDVVSISSASSIIGTFTETGQRKISRSRSRQSSRITEAKLKEAYREMPSMPAVSGSQPSLRHGDRQELVTQSRSIDPRMLAICKSSNVQNEPTTDISMGMEFKSYVEQSKPHAQDEPGRHAKLHQSSAEPLPDTILSQRVESSPSNRAHRLLTLKRASELGTNDSRRAGRPIEPERSPIRIPSVNKTPEHRRASQSRIANEVSELVDNAPATTTKNLVPQARRSQTAFQHTRPPQTTINTPMDWDAGDMADESSAFPPVAKKPKLTKATARPASRQSQPGAQSRAETTRLDGSGAPSVLKRPKAASAKGQKSQQADAKVNHDEFDIEDDEEIPAPTSTTGKATKKQGRNAAGKNVKSQASKPTKGAATKPAAKGRKVLQSMDIKKTLAANRPRRSQPKSKKYIDESGSDIEYPYEELEDMPEKANSNTMTAKRRSVANHELQEPAIGGPLPRPAAESPPMYSNSKVPDQVHSDHEAAVTPHAPVQVLAKTTEVAMTYETLVIASPARADGKEPQTHSNGSKNANASREEEEYGTELQEITTRVDGDNSPDETAEDSYPKVTTKFQGASVSFGSKLGQFINPIGVTKTALDADITPLSNAKSFVGAVNKTRSTSPKKPRQTAAARTSKDDDTDLFGNAGSTTRNRDDAGSGKLAVPKVPTKEQAAAPSPKNRNITQSASNDTPRPRTAKKQPTQRARLGSPKKLPKQQKATVSSGTPIRGAAQPAAPSVAQQNAEFDDTTLGQEDLDALGEDEQNRAIQEDNHLQDQNTPIDLTQDSDDDISVTGLNQFDHTPAISGDIDTEVTMEARVIKEHDTRETSALRQGELFLRQSTQSARARLPCTERGTREKTPQHLKLPHTADPPKRRDQAVFQDEVPALRGSTTKKSQLVHFNTQGPQNQGVPSPKKQTRKSAMSQVHTSEAKGSVAYQHSRFAAARRNPFFKVPTLQSESPDFADEEYDESGIVVEDDTVMQDVWYEVREGRANSMHEETANALTCHLPPQGSQSSRVDHNGSPRLSPSHLNHLAELDPDMNVTADVSDEHSNVEDEDPTAPTEQSASGSDEPASQGSDQSFHLSSEAPPPIPSDRAVRSRPQAHATAISSSKLIKQAERKLVPANMRIKKAPRESLGLNDMVQKQYPQAQKNVATDSFKKPTMRTEVANLLEVSSGMPMIGHKAPAQASNIPRQPLKEVSTNSKKATVAEEPLPNCTTEFSSAEPARFNEPQTKTPIQPHLASDAQDETPASLMTTLLGQRASRAVQEEETILESLNRRADAHQSARDADRTLVEDNKLARYAGGKAGEASSVNSVSPPPEAGITTGLRQDDARWREGIRKTQRRVRDALMEITNTVLIRLENEEKLIERTVESYNTGCGNVRRTFQEKQTKMLGVTRQKVLKIAHSESVKVHGIFARLQEGKRYVRSGDTKDQVQQAIKETQSSLINDIEHMLEQLGKSSITEVA